MRRHLETVRFTIRPSAMPAPGRRLAALVLFPFALAGCGGREPLTPRPPTAPPPSPESEWLAENAAPVAVSFEASAEDLAPIGAALGAARVVVLGFEAPLAGPTREAHARITRYLHEVHGFDALVVDGSLFDCGTVADRIAADPADVAGDMEGCVSRFVAGAGELADFWSWIGAEMTAGTPIALAGAALHLVGSASDGVFGPALRDVLATIQSTALGDPGWMVTDSLLEDANTRTTAVRDLPPQAERAAFARVIETAVADLASSGLAPRVRERWVRVLQGMRLGLETEWELFEIRPAPGSARSAQLSSALDSAVAANIVWLIEREFPGAKAVVWAPNETAARGLDRTGSFVDGTRIPFHADRRTVGDALQADLGPAVYSLGFTSARGFDGVRGLIQHTGAVALEGDLESFFVEAGSGTSFLDYRTLPPGGEWLQRTQISRALGWQRLEAVWASLFDGAFFIPETGPLTP